ncbi:MAG TPA: adenylate/guanylate cyclase domain-containing protein [Dehalococcoidia bacterium]|nr:adenylate/guanylate cyclase domain-containing protein [Dehalococcoidia bacterium]
MPDPGKIAMLAGLEEGRVRRWLDAGLFERVTPRTEDWVARAHVLSQLERAGVPLAILQAADHEDVLARAYIFEFLQVAREGQHSFRELSEASALDEQLLLRICDALGIDDPSVFSDAEAALLQALGEAIGEGLPVGMALELCEVWGNQMRFIAHAEVMSYDVNLARPRIGGTGSPLKAAAQLAPLTRAMLRASDLFPQPLHRRHLLQAIELVTDTDLAATASLAEGLAPGEVMTAIGFVDLTGYTAITQDEGDRQALAYARRLEALVREASHAHDMRIVKRLGDGFMLASPSCTELLSGLLYVVRAAEERDDMPAARAGVAYGRAVSRGGDYFGHTVNLAARVLDQAEPSEVLVSEDCVQEAGAGPFGFHEPRDAKLKGIREPVRIWRAESLSSGPPTAARQD